MILNYAIKYITKNYLIYHLVLCNMCKNVHKLFFPLNAVYLYTVSNLHINVLLLGQHAKKRIVIMGVINGHILIIISNISQDN